MTARIALLTLLALTSGCASWTTPAAPLPEVIEKSREGTVRVTRSTGERTVLLQPALQDSALFGTANVERCWRDLDGVRMCQSRRTQLRIPRSDITRIETPTVNPVGHGALVGSLGFAGIGTAFLFAAQLDCGNNVSECAGFVLKSAALGALWGALAGGVALVGRAP